MEFRIKVFLYDFFLDYRKVSYLFVNKDMKVIQDLMNHISEKFEINSGLYLTTENVYLPPFEDIRILKVGDPVVVSKHINIETTSKKKSKHKALKELDITSFDQDVYNHCKQKVHNELDEPMDMAVDEFKGKDCTDFTTKPEKKKKKKCKLSQLENETVTESLILTDNDTFKPTSIKKSNDSQIDLSKPLRVAEAVVAEFTRKKPGGLLPISTIPKIIKPIVVYDNSDHNTVETSVCNPSSSSDESGDTLQVQEEVVPAKVNGDLNHANSFDQSFEGPEVKKRKRKRVRTRKPKPAPLPIPLPISTPISSVPSSPRLHIWFENDTVNVPNALSNGTEENKEVVDIDKEQGVNYKDLCEKEIMSFPIMRDVEPKVNDIIAFKRFMLSDNYTPEISNYIIGNVRSYSPFRSTIVFRILEGKDQCNDPTGKFYMEENGNLLENNQEVQFTWPELVEPRLLFP